MPKKGGTRAAGGAILLLAWGKPSIVAVLEVMGTAQKLMKLKPWARALPMESLAIKRLGDGLRGGLGSGTPADR